MHEYEEKKRLYISQKNLASLQYQFQSNLARGNFFIFIFSQYFIFYNNDVMYTFSALISQNFFSATVVWSILLNLYFNIHCCE